ncbi:hypothetical protein L7F22_034651 [Adiantum nelumboides]|nr:hypothetical protein [Adiantum nelumboides]
MHLSLAGRASVVNQVLLATAWFTTSCWTLYPKALSRLRRLVRNFLWGGSDGTRDTRPRVSWHTVILPRQEEAHGIIDPEMQSAALLLKLIVRGLYSGEEPWKHGDPEAVEVQQSDLKHLDPYEFLNDTVIDFYIKYLQRPEFLSQEKKENFYFFNTFFFKKLLLEKRKKTKGSSYYSELRKWTKGVNIFEKKYLLVPVHDCAHWSLAIICFATNPQERNKVLPYILHLDSMREGHLSKEVFHVLSRYIEAEWNHIRGLDANDENCTTVLKEFVSKRVEVPLQQNAWDCGLFLLYFIECFLRDADDIFEPHLLDSMFGRQWFKPQEASALRKRIRSVLENLMQELNDEIMMEDMD